MMRLSELAFQILLALGEGPSHGYAIGKDVEERSGGRLDPTTGTLYQVLQRLAADGLIAAAKSPGGWPSTSEKCTKRSARRAKNTAIQ